MCSSESTGTNMTEGPVEYEEDLQYTQIMDRTLTRRIITCWKCGESDQKSSQYQCRSCRRLLELHLESQLKTLGSATAALTHKYGLIWQPRGATQEGAAVESARATRHWVSTISNGYESIRDRYYRDGNYRSFMGIEGIGVDHMEYWNEIGDPTRGAAP